MSAGAPSASDAIGLSRANLVRAIRLPRSGTASGVIPEHLAQPRGVPRLGSRRKLRRRRASTPAEKVLEAVQGHPKKAVYRVRREDARDDKGEHYSEEHQAPVVSTESRSGGCEFVEPLLQRNNLILRERVRVLHIPLELIKMLDDFCLLIWCVFSASSGAQVRISRSR